MNKPKQNRPTGRLKRRQEDNIKLILKEILCDVNWVKLASDNATPNVTGKSSSMLVGSQFKISAQNLALLVTNFHSISQSLFKSFQLVFQTNARSFFSLYVPILYLLITIDEPHRTVIFLVQ